MSFTILFFEFTEFIILINKSHNNASYSSSGGGLSGETNLDDEYKS
jgi:hypothetical protein